MQDSAFNSTQELPPIKSVESTAQARYTFYMQTIRLFINLYPMDEGDRLEEIATCLRHNLANRWISEIVVLNEGFPKEALLQHDKVRSISIQNRPPFSEYHQHLAPQGITILSNNDIWFDNSLRKLSFLHLTPYDLLALTRRETDGALYKPKEADAQDSWIFKGPADPLKDCTFPMGIPGCENRLAFLFFAKRFRVLNPSKVIHTHHEHASQQRGYQNENRVAGDYLLTRPVGFAGFHFYRLILTLLQRTRILRVKNLGRSNSETS